ncbi:hypothetical protein SM120_01195 [Lactococcus lactis subsp. lactis]|uniref:hypothetical protein n=2 Tax=Lactococcus lactis TaxID=1358 RepID=UPI001F3D94EB|nr:hypothetical protein [Lactococcus lactis]MCG1001676.1 hypothetical protein [Lactococcus lactis]MDY4362256.1 hypothetical protein [Lactococcus lactis subsp. lactis]
MDYEEMIEIEEKVRESKGFKVLIAMLDEYFGKDNYQIRQYQFDGYPGNDPNVDFTIIVDLPKLKGVSFGVLRSGNPEMFRSGGTGSIAIGIPTEDTTSRLISGEHGTGLAYALGQKEWSFGAGVDDVDDLHEYFDIFMDYYHHL